MKDKKVILLTFFTLVLTIALFVMLYSSMLTNLPLFGDAATISSITHSLIKGESFNSNINYPLLYYIVQSFMVLIFGDIGFNLIIIIGLILIGLGVFFLVKEITNKNYLSILALIFVLSSSKIIFYSARMYMEIFLSGLFIFSIFLFISYLKYDSKRYLVLSAILIGFTTSVKQQGLFVLLTSVIFFFVLMIIIRPEKKKRSFIFKDMLLFFIISFLILLFPYANLLHTDGMIIPGTDEFYITNEINSFGQKISLYNLDNQEINFNEKYGSLLESIKDQYYQKATEKAEERHIWPWDPFISLSDFLNVNSLYLEKFGGGNTSSNLANTMNVLLITGMLMGIATFLFTKKNIKYDKRLFGLILLFFIVFTLINYAIFFRTNDQTRYHLFIPVLFSIFLIIPIYFFIHNILINFSKTLKLIIIGILILLVFISFIDLTVKDSIYQQKWKSSQLYTPSIGGIDSVEEVGKWVKDNTNKDDLIWQTCGSELLFYSERKVIGDYRVYFFNSSEREEAFKDRNVKFLVIFDSQIVNDGSWDNICKVPKSFANDISKNYPIAYKSSYKDINVYQIS